MLLPATLASQEGGTLTGQVIDGATNQPLASAQVSIPALNVGSLTQQNGRFILINVPPGSHVVSVQRIGYRSGSATVTIVPGGSVNQVFSLTQEALALDEIIVTGTPGGTQRRAVGNTVQRLSVAEIAPVAPITDFQDLLQSRSPGIRFSVGIGNIGTGSQVSLRGINSFSTTRSNPLIYVDGIRVNNNTQAGPNVGENAGAVNVLNDFNPNDIESIEIIKGPAAATLYGADAASGVIQIITKRGREGAPEYTLMVRQGANFVTNPAGRLGTMWTCPTNFAPGIDSRGNGCRTREDLVPYNMYDEGTRYIREGYFDWETPNLFSYGHSQGYTLDVRGGTSAIRYFVSGTWDDQTGIVKYNWDQSASGRANLSLLLSEALSVDVSTGFVSGKTRFDQAAPTDGGIWQDMFWSNGYWLDRITPFGSTGNCVASRCRPDVRLGGFQEHLPTDVRDNTFAYREYDRFTGSGTLNHARRDIGLGFLGTGSLNQRAIMGLDKGWDTNTTLFKVQPGIVPEHLRQYTDTWSPVYILGRDRDGEMTYQRPINTNVTLDYAVTGGVVLNQRWNFDTSVGLQYYFERAENFQAAGQGFASPLSTTLNQLTQSRVNNDYSKIENKARGVFVQQQVGWNDRVFLTGALRWDDNSTFGAASPAQRYPKLSGTWVISDEPFWRLDMVNSLRFRGAWGKAGRQPTALAGLNTFVAIPGPGGISALRPSSPGNPRIQPEVSTELEFGVDYALFNDRLSGELAYFTKKTEGLLLDVAPLASFSLPGTIATNAGRIDGWGWEATLNARVVQARRLSFDLDFSADFNDNEIKDLGDFPGNAAIRIGHPYPFVTQPTWVTHAEFLPTGDTRRHTTANIFGQRVYAECDSGVRLAPADASKPNQYGIVPGGQIVPCTDVVRGQGLYVGRAFSPWSFTVSPRLSALNNRIQISAVAQGMYGRWNDDNAQAWGHIYNNSAISRIQDDPMWVALNFMEGTGAGFSKSRYKADFWKLREVGATYQVPQWLMGRTGASRGTLSVAGRNLLTIWQAQKEIYGKPVVDPEFGATNTITGGSNFRAAPPLSSFSATLRVSF
jgi:TonB-linked SusC/RagA family outer membrane protein